MPTSAPTEIKTAYAEQGAAQLRGPGVGRFATVLYADAERTRWLAVSAKPLDEGEVVHLAGHHCNARVTWAGREQPGTIQEHWEKHYGPDAQTKAVA